MKENEKAELAEVTNRISCVVSKLQVHKRVNPSFSV